MNIADIDKQLTALGLEERDLQQRATVAMERLIDGIDEHAAQQLATAEARLRAIPTARERLQVQRRDLLKQEELAENKRLLEQYELDCSIADRARLAELELLRAYLEAVDERQRADAAAGATKQTLANRHVSVPSVPPERYRARFASLDDATIGVLAVLARCYRTAEGNLFAWDESRKQDAYRVFGTFETAYAACPLQFIEAVGLEVQRSAST